MTNKGVWLRGALYVAIVVVAYLVGDEVFRGAVRPLVLSALSALSVALVALRAYIDQSPTQEQREAESETPAGNAADPQSVIIENRADDAVPVAAAQSTTEEEH